MRAVARLSLLRPAALALALALSPACATVAPLDAAVVAARAPDQRAYAVLQTYAAALEAAADIVRDPAVPLEFKRVLGELEAVATPAAEALALAAAAYSQAPTRAEAVQQLNTAVAAAEAPIAALARTAAATHTPER